VRERERERERKERERERENPLTLPSLYTLSYSYIITTFHHHCFPSSEPTTNYIVFSLIGAQNFPF